ncbi:ubiquinol-cytochrome C reductase hinge protein-domain-containing protein [Xylariaceae sp. FL0255]|nr:ubiquinol-cytochrome C reductase hinge protein-domain-containing protein [Xylariaceae sp. FL0255]
MTFWDAISDLVDAATPWSTAEAEAPPPEEKDAPESQDEGTDDDSKASDDEPAADDEKEEASEDSEEAEGEDAEEEGEGEEEEEEEDEEELEDPKEKLEEECKESKQCAPAKHHFDECVERVTNASDDAEEKEDCVEEFFHLAHCAAQCAAPKLWSVLK